MGLLGSPNLNPLDFSIWTYTEHKARTVICSRVDELLHKPEAVWEEMRANYIRACRTTFCK